MKVEEQGIGPAKTGGKQRYQAVPRTLIFVTSRNPESNEEEVLLLKGAPTKRLWANHFNGLGGHVERDEDIQTAAEREWAEETGLPLPTLEPLTLRGVVNIETGAESGVLVFVFRGRTDQRLPRPSPEGTPEWIPLDRLADYPLVDDLPHLLPRTLSDTPIFFAHYAPDADGVMQYSFR